MFEQFFKNKLVEVEVEKTSSKEKEENKSVQDLLRSKGFKIKSILVTSFGKQIDFAKKYDDGELKKVLKDFNFKIKDKSIFIIE